MQESAGAKKNFMFKRTNFYLELSLLVVLFICIAACCNRGRGDNCTSKSNENELQKVQHKQIVNIYVENSGSMKGYFYGNSQIKGVIKQYYDRIAERQKEGDTITLNYINTEIENSPNEIKGYLKNTQSKCIASYTKIDDILSMAMESLNDSTVNIVISDLCFTSNDGSLAMAQSGITEIFTRRLNKNTDLSMAIVKYMSDFNGLFFPGGISNKKPLPFYLWIFGNEMQVKKIVNLPINTQTCGVLTLQPTQMINPQIRTKKARMIEDNCIIVKEWDKDRNRENKTYSVLIELNMSKVILGKEDICNVANYQITDGYIINSITDIGNDTYSFTISTQQPSPGTLSIVYLQQDMPEWVALSNYDGNGIPKDSTTLGIKYLIEGAYDAYRNTTNRLFETKIILK